MHLTLSPVLGATLASYVVGSLWYVALGRRWRSAIGWDPGAAYRPSPSELTVALIGQVAISVALATVLDVVGTATVLSAMAVAGLIWLGFVLPTLATNVVFQRRPSALVWQDGGHWLLILIVQAAVQAGLS